jgi:hypothetical protein
MQLVLELLGKTVMATPPRIVLTPFFRPRDEDAEEQQMYVAGFVDEEDETWGYPDPTGRVEQAD